MDVCHIFANICNSEVIILIKVSLLEFRGGLKDFNLKFTSKTSSKTGYIWLQRDLVATLTLLKTLETSASTADGSDLHVAALFSLV